MIGLWWAGLALGGVVSDGAAALEEGHLDEAIEIWSAARGGRLRASGIIEYNLGTAWYRKGDWPRAIAHLRAAARLRPRDGAIHHNLALARAELGAVPPPAALPAAWMAVLTPGELGVLGLLLTSLGSVVLVGGRLAGRGRAPGLGLLAVGLVVGGISSWGGAQLAWHPIGVIVDGEAILRDAASVNAGERLRLKPGTEVRIERSYGGFLLVIDGRDRRGWLTESAAAVAW
ncbi:MAG TPA: tetratricopeptide repeat protein [Deltaproteobacteria bacterium]|nr:tetratricopeptide repeat protein [Deltaproteobacteria bacterium]